MSPVRYASKPSNTIARAVTAVITNSITHSLRLRSTPTSYDDTLRSLTQSKQSPFDRQHIESRKQHTVRCTYYIQIVFSRLLCLCVCVCVCVCMCMCVRACVCMFIIPSLHRQQQPYIFSNYLHFVIISAQPFASFQNVDHQVIVKVCDG